MSKCVSLAEQTITVITNVSGDREVINTDGIVESYRIKNANYMNGPIPVEWDGNHGASVNFSIVYIFSIA